MGDQLFYSYTSDGSLSKALESSHKHPYSIVFDKKRSSILVDQHEFGQGVISAAYHYAPRRGALIDWEILSNLVEHSTNSNNYATFGTTKLISDIQLSVDERGHYTKGALLIAVLPSISYVDNLSLSGANSTTGYSISLTYTMGDGNGERNREQRNNVIIPIASLNSYGVVKIGSGSGKVGISSGVLTYAAAKTGALKYKVNGTQYSTGFNANSSSAVNEFNLKSGTHVTVTYSSSGDITFDTTGVVTSETPLSLGTGTGSGSIITSLSVSGHTITASYISVDDLTGGGADHFQSASFTSGLQISTHQENGVNSGTGHLYVPVATASQYGVIKPMYVNSTYTSANLLRKKAADRNYALGLTSDGFAYVNVPWSNTHNSHALTITDGTASLITSAGTITFVESTNGCSATSGDLTATTTRKKILIGSGSNLVGINSSGQLTYTNTDSQCTLSGHYSPTSNSNYTLSATADTGKAIASITLKRDSKGHITDISKTEIAVGSGGENCVTYTGESNGIHKITVATAPGTTANTLYIVL